MSTQPVTAPDATQDFMPLHGIDHVELWVGNAQQAAYYYTHAYGFREVERTMVRLPDGTELEGVAMERPIGETARR